MSEERIRKAIELAVRYGGIDGSHHKTSRPEIHQGFEP